MRPPGRRTLTVSEITSAVIDKLERSFPSVYVKGEVSDLVRHGSGHWYFSLKDDRAVLRAVMFKYQNRFVRFAPEEGMEVLCRGKISGYAPRGAYQLNVDHMEPLGRGALHAEFERLKEKLAREGLFGEDRKRPIPLPLRRVAIITSATGAALHDMLRILGEGDPSIEVLIVPSRVQGEGSAAELVAALAMANRADLASTGSGSPIEAIIVGRGGGSLEDLWSFNDEGLARAIASSRLPVISAVGHEVDVTLSDLAADLRAPTPTAAAGILVRARAERAEALGRSSLRLARSMDGILRNADKGLAHLSSRLRHPGRALDERAMRLDEAESRLRRLAGSRLAAEGRAVQSLAERLRATDPRRAQARDLARLEDMARRLARAQSGMADRNEGLLERLAVKLDAISPAATLARGYAIARMPDGSVLRDSSRVGFGDDLEVLLHKGSLQVEVTDVKE